MMKTVGIAPGAMNTAPIDGECGDFNYFYFCHYEVCTFYKTSLKIPCDASN